MNRNRKNTEHKLGISFLLWTDATVQRGKRKNAFSGLESITLVRFRKVKSILNFLLPLFF